MKLTATSARTIFSLPMAALLVGISACGGEAEDDGTGAAAIAGSTTVTNAFEDANTYVRSAVALTVSSPSGTYLCSGTKIGATRYLTAAHCVTGARRGNTIKISNWRDGAITTTISKAFVHPSWRKVASATSSYDIGILDVKATSSVPIWNNFDYGFVPDTQDNSSPYRLVAFGLSNAGCTTAGAGLARWADFQSWSRSASPKGRDWDGIYSHNVIEYNDPNGCDGDSGGPLFDKATGNIVGVENGTAIVSSRPTLFTRIDKLQSFISDPLTACRNGCDAECLDRITSTDTAALYPQCFDGCVSTNC